MGQRLVQVGTARYGQLQAGTVLKNFNVLDLAPPSYVPYHFVPGERLGGEPPGI